MFSRSLTTLRRHAATILSTGLLASVSALAQPNIIIRDCPSDVGLPEPTPYNTCGVVWGSPDIKVQTTSTYSSVAPHAAQAGQDNYVFVTVKNIGNQTLGSGTVYVHWAKFALNQVWPSGWNNYLDNQGRLIGDLVGSVAVSNIAPGATVILPAITWPLSNVPNPNDFNEQYTHLCLVARFVSDEDPMTYTEGLNMETNTRNNNNIGWRNADVSKPSKPTIHCIVGNPFDESKTVQIRFNERPSRDGESFLNFGEAIVDLTQELFDKWNAQGRPGDNIRAYSEGGDDSRIVLEDASATLGDLDFDGNEQYTLAVEFRPQSEEIGDRVFEWDLAQHMDGDDEPFGGATITIDQNARPDDYNPDEGHPDIVIRDCPADNGTVEPTPNSTCSYVWGSPDIKVQTSPTYSASAPHAAQAGSNNYVFVTVTNIGNADLNSGTVEVYWAKFAANQVWQSGWLNHYDNNVPPRKIGDLIGTIPVSNIQAGTTVTLPALTWAAADVPNPANFNETSTHICLVARFVSNEDPMSFAEGPNQLDNTRNNNNIGWRNTDVAKSSKPVIHCIIGNPFEREAGVTVKFSERPTENGASFNDHGRVWINIPADMMASIEASENPTENLSDWEVSEDGTTYRATVTGSPATIGEVHFGGNEQYTIGIEFEAEDPAGIGDQTFDWDIAQHMDGGVEPFGGGTVTVDWNAQDADKRAVSSEDASIAGYQLMARPNPTSGSTTISYLLPGEATVTLAIYDASGNLVRTLVDGATVKRGSHEIEWNGMTTTGTKAPAGTYFYRLQAGSRKIEGQLKIVR